MSNLFKKEKKKRDRWLVPVYLSSLRKVRDSNPRYPKRVYRISSPARSITLPTFLSISKICGCYFTH